MWVVDKISRQVPCCVRLFRVFKWRRIDISSYRRGGGECNIVGDGLMNIVNSQVRKAVDSEDSLVFLYKEQ
jgi:hypothetical protein